MDPTAKREWRWADYGTIEWYRLVESGFVTVEVVGERNLMVREISGTQSA